MEQLTGRDIHLAYLTATGTARPWDDLASSVKVSYEKVAQALNVRLGPLGENDCQAQGLAAQLHATSSAMSAQEEEDQGAGATFTPSYDSRTDTWNFDRGALDRAVLSLGMDARYAHKCAAVLVRLQQSQRLQAKALALVREIEAQVDEYWAGFAKRMRRKIMQTVPDSECVAICQIIEQATQGTGGGDER